jgi:hypothetical protein
LEKYFASVFRIGEETRQESSMEKAENRGCCLIHAGFLFGFFNPEDGGRILIRNVRRLYKPTWYYIVED